MAVRRGDTACQQGAGRAQHTAAACGVLHGNPGGHSHACVGGGGGGDDGHGKRRSRRCRWVKTFHARVSLLSASCLACWAWGSIVSP
jgi:hypothetical protein